jgi:fatty-acyl-CoA synthase
VLAISGPTVFPGYVTGHDGRGRLLDGTGRPNHGWLDTGDLARVDEEGSIYLAGRAKDLSIRGGHNIDPAVIEDALLAHPQVGSRGNEALPGLGRGPGFAPEHL